MFLYMVVGADALLRTAAIILAGSNCSRSARRSTVLSIALYRDWLSYWGRFFLSVQRRTFLDAAKPPVRACGAARLACMYTRCRVEWHVCRTGEEWSWLENVARVKKSWPGAGLVASSSFFCGFDLLDDSGGGYYMLDERAEGVYFV